MRRRMKLTWYLFAMRRILRTPVGVRGSSLGYGSSLEKMYDGKYGSHKIGLYIESLLTIRSTRPLVETRDPPRYRAYAQEAHRRMSHLCPRCSGGKTYHERWESGWRAQIDGHGRRYQQKIDEEELLWFLHWSRFVLVESVIAQRDRHCHPQDRD